MIYNNTGTVGLQDADIFITLNENHGRTADYVRTLRERLPRLFPSDLLLSAARHHQPDPELRRAGAAGCAGDRHRSATPPKPFALRILRQIRNIPGLVDARMQQSSNQPQLRSMPTAAAWRSWA
jgi:hypothetical protein